jgi:hypothetical protein
MEDGVKRFARFAELNPFGRMMALDLALAGRRVSVFDLPGAPPAEDMVTSRREHLFGTASRAIRGA